jgi:hypothetical protein
MDEVGVEVTGFGALASEVCRLYASSDMGMKGKWRGDFVLLKRMKAEAKRAMRRITSEGARIAGGDYSSQIFW